MSIEIASIPTTYAGIQMRSRLEAKWACFYDQCGWKWSYEPRDYNGWIPDFAIGERPTLVEVKPFFRFDEWHEDAIGKIVESGCKEPVILFGADATFAMERGEDVPMIGWILFPGNQFPDVEELHFGTTAGNDMLGLCPNYGAWVNYIWNVPEKRIRYPNHPNKWSQVWDGIGEQNNARNILKHYWAAACNVVQWRPT